MEKLIYLLSRPSTVEMEDFKATLLTPVVAALREHGAGNITINIADLNKSIEEIAPGRLMGPWQDFDVHPLRWSYIRNAVARPLTPAAPTYRAIVSEHFHSLEDFTDESRYFGSQEALMEMIEHMPGFCDLGNMVSLGMSEYHFD